jgi:phospholipase/carboxylesterase
MTQTGLALESIVIRVGRLFILLFILLFGGTVALSQVVREYETEIDGFEYIEIVKGRDDGLLPLLIAFHYSGGNPAETISNYDDLQMPVRIILPKGNHKKRDGFSYFPVDYYEKDTLAQFELSKVATDSIARFIKSVTAKYRQKAVVSGISQGGDIAFLLARYYPELLKASFPFAAVINSYAINGLGDKQVSRVPIYLFQGESDHIVSVAFTRKRIDEIDGMLEIQLRTYPGLGHDISHQMRVDYSSLIDRINEN